LHAINNLLQEPAFSRRSFDELCENLTPNKWINPHKSVIGTGYYDANVLAAALELKNCTWRWHDQRKKLSDIDFNACLGILINVTDKGFIWSSKHWFSIRKVGDIFYNFDSLLKHPEKVGSETEIPMYIQKIADRKKTEVILVKSDENVMQKSFYKSENEAIHVSSISVYAEAIHEDTNECYNGTGSADIENSSLSDLEFSMNLLSTSTPRQKPKTNSPSKSLSKSLSVKRLSNCNFPADNDDIQIKLPIYKKQSIREIISNT